MNDLQAIEIRELVPPGAIVDNAAFTTRTIDMKGIREALFLVQFGAMDIAAAVFKLTESEDSGMSGATDVTGGDFSVSPATVPSATSDNTIFGIHVKNRGNRKRYLDISLTGGDGTAGTYAGGVVLLIPDTAPSTATLRGLAQCLYV